MHWPPSGMAGRCPNRDFLLGEVDSSSTWLKTAAAENMQASQRMQAFQSQMDGANAFQKVDINDGPVRPDRLWHFTRCPF